jgi:NAD(P)H dehydrogenase (quinone)
MKVLIAYAHLNPKSFCHAVLESFTKGLEDGEHTYEVIDLYGTKFEPALKIEDMAMFTGGQMPQDVLAQQEKVNQADALAFIYPVIGYGQPAMILGWQARVLSYGFAWKTGEKGLEGLLKHQKAICIATAGMPEQMYKASGVEDAMKKIVGTIFWTYGIQNQELVTLFGVQTVDDETRKRYLEGVYQKGKEF